MLTLKVFMLLPLGCYLFEYFCCFEHDVTVHSAYVAPAIMLPLEGYYVSPANDKVRLKLFAGSVPYTFLTRVTVRG